MIFSRGRRQHAQIHGFAKPDEALQDVSSRHTRDGWTHVRDHESVLIDGKQYRNMREWKKPCSVCGEDMSAYEKANMVDASSRFSNRTCKAHRGLLPAVEAGYIVWRDGKMHPGPACGSTEVISTAKDEALKMREAHIANLEAELKEVYAKLDGLEPAPASDVMPWDKT